MAGRPVRGLDRPGYGYSIPAEDREVLDSANLTGYDPPPLLDEQGQPPRPEFWLYRLWLSHR